MWFEPSILPSDGPAANTKVIGRWRVTRFHIQSNQRDIKLSVLGFNVCYQLNMMSCFASSEDTGEISDRMDK